MTTERWKCPDCEGWVRDDVETHYCEEEAEDKSVQPYQPFIYSGWTCGRCGAWITSGNYHACWTYTPNTNPPYYQPIIYRYPNTTYRFPNTAYSQSGSTATIRVITTNNNTGQNDEDDGLAGVKAS